MKHLSYLRVVLPITIISFLMTFPAIINQHWALLDDAELLIYAKVFSEDWMIHSEGSGRFRPFFWFYHAIQYSLFGTEVRSYYLIQSFILILTTLLIYEIVKLLTKNSILSWMAVATFFSSSCLTESYYTISKQEPILVLLLLVSIYCFLRSESSIFDVYNKISSNSKQNIPWFRLLVFLLASTLSLLFAWLTKETTLIVLFASIFWILATLLLSKLGRSEYQANPKLLIPVAYLIVNCLSFLMMVVFSYGFGKTPPPWSSGTYSNSSLVLVSSLNEITTYLRTNLDTSILTIFLFFGIVIPILLKPDLLNKKIVSYALLFSLCSVGYLSLFAFFWVHKLTYYSLPIAAWNSILLALFVKNLSEIQSKNKYYITSVVIVFVLVFTRLFSIPTLYNVALAHQAWTQVNSQMLQEIIKLPLNSQVVFNYEKNHQYLIDVKRLLNDVVYKRPDIFVGSMYSQEDYLKKVENKFIFVNFGAEDNSNVFVRAMNPPPLSEFEERSSSIEGLDLEKSFIFESQKRMILPFSLKSFIFKLGWVGYRVLKPSGEY